MKTIAPQSPASALSQYFTRPQTAAACLAHLAKTLPDLQADLYLEPSAGAGAFLDQMPTPRLGMDIAPQDNEILTQDFLLWCAPKGIERIVVIGNPPFGSGGAEAVAFFNHAAEFADTIAMIMPASFLKPAQHHRLDAHFHLVSEMPLIDETFQFEGTLKKISAVFQVWLKRATPRAKRAKRAVTHQDFAFVPNLADADFVIRRVGVRAGAILAIPVGVKTPGYSPESNLYVKACGPDPAAVIQRFRTLDLETTRKQSVTMPSVSKSDLVALYEQAKTAALAGTASAPCPAEPVSATPKSSGRHEAPYQYSFDFLFPECRSLAQAAVPSSQVDRTAQAGIRSNETHPVIRDHLDQTDTSSGADAPTTASEAETSAGKASLKSQLGQFMTPTGIANFMAQLFSLNGKSDIKILDAGAGAGSLSSAVLTVARQQCDEDASVDITAYEIDPDMLKLFRAEMAQHKDVPLSIHSGDYIELAARERADRRFTHVILNPPYKKIKSSSDHRKILRSAGIEATNLYSAFVSLALRDLQDEGELVAIIPRSFCNGPYFKPFRDLLLDQTAIKRIHLFQSRSEAFKEDRVLQENIIISVQRGVEQGKVVVSTSNDGTFADLVETSYPFCEIVNPEDRDKFINIPTNGEGRSLEDRAITPETLKGIAVSVSTGPVMGFRLKEYLRKEWDKDCAPLIYPSHLKNSRAQWPTPNGKKPNAIHENSHTSKCLYPNGYYCVVRRFSSKEERHRIVASVISPDTFPDATKIGLDNQLNVFHQNKAGLSPEMAHGLCAYLNTDMVDVAFRLFSGHTQINATDLRRMRYPPAGVLEELGAWVLTQQNPMQDEIYERLRVLNANEGSYPTSDRCAETSKRSNITNMPTSIESLVCS